VTARYDYPEMAVRVRQPEHGLDLEMQRALDEIDELRVKVERLKADRAQLLDIVDDLREAAT
jgi:hypothetical protein